MRLPVLIRVAIHWWRTLCICCAGPSFVGSNCFDSRPRLSLSLPPYSSRAAGTCCLDPLMAQEPSTALLCVLLLTHVIKSQHSALTALHGLLFGGRAPCIQCYRPSAALYMRKCVGGVAAKGARGKHAPKAQAMGLNWYKA